MWAETWMGSQATKWAGSYAAEMTDQAVEGFSPDSGWVADIVATSPTLGIFAAICWWMLRQKLGTNGSGVKSMVERIENSVKHIDECVDDLRERVTKVEGTSGFVEAELKVSSLSVQEMRVQMARVEQKLEDFS